LTNISHSQPRRHPSQTRYSTRPRTVKKIQLTLAVLIFTESNQPDDAFDYDISLEISTRRISSEPSDLTNTRRHNNEGHGTSGCVIFPLYLLEKFTVRIITKPSADLKIKVVSFAEGEKIVLTIE